MGQNDPADNPEAKWSDDLGSYERFIAQMADRAADGTPSDTVYNKSPIHASVLIKHLIFSAKRELRILSGSLNEGVYSPKLTVDAMINFLTIRAGTVRVLLDWEPSRTRYPLEVFTNEHPLLRAIAHANVGREQFQIEYVPERVARLYSFHFLIADRTSFRIEQDRTKFEAIAQFGNIGLAEKFANRFDQLWLLSAGATQVRAAS